MNYSREELLYMYRHLLHGRIFVERMEKAVYAGELKAFFHTPYGQEAIAVGIVSAMRDNPNDWVQFNHRDQCGNLMKYDLYPFVAEMLAKKDGVMRGTAFDIHCHNLENRLLPCMAIVGAGVPYYTGFAWSLKLRKTNEVMVIPFGDGAVSEGVVYEAWNLAALYKVPAVYIIENNQWALSVPLERQSSNPNLAEKAVPCGLPIEVVDGNDILAVRDAVKKGIEKARNFEPNVIELKTLRWGPHFVGQDNPWQDHDMIEEYKRNNDPVKRYENYLIENKIIDQEYIVTLTKELSENLEKVIQKAVAAEIPTYDDVYGKDLVYATPETGGDL